MVQLVWKTFWKLFMKTNILIMIPFLGGICQEKQKYMKI